MVLLGFLVILNWPVLAFIAPLGTTLILEKVKYELYFMCSVRPEPETWFTQTQFRYGQEFHKSNLMNQNQNS
jgi:hypothetical protein